MEERQGGMGDKIGSSSSGYTDYKMDIYDEKKENCRGLCIDTECIYRMEMHSIML